MVQTRLNHNNIDVVRLSRPSKPSAIRKYERRTAITLVADREALVADMRMQKGFFREQAWV